MTKKHFVSFKFKISEFNSYRRVHCGDYFEDNSDDDVDENRGRKIISVRAALVLNSVTRGFDYHFGVDLTVQLHWKLFITSLLLKLIWLYN